MNEPKRQMTVNSVRAAALIAVLAFWPTADVAAQAGAYARMGFGARGIAMSNAVTADVTGAGSAYYNPALAPFAERQTINGTVALMSLDRQLQYLEFATPLRPRAGVTAGLVHAGISGIDGRDASGYHTRDYSTNEFAFFVGFGTRITDRLATGLTFQIFRADLLDELSATNSIGIDLGAVFRATDALTIGVALDDLLARYTWDTSGLFGGAGKSTRDNFPTRFRLGAGYTFAGGQARVLGEFESSFTSRENRQYVRQIVQGVPVERAETERLTMYDHFLRVGGEYLLTDIFALRAGVDQIGDEFDGVRPSAGFMVQQGLGELLLTVDYAFVLEPYAVGSLHFLTLRVGL